MKISPLARPVPVAPGDSQTRLLPAEKAADTFARVSATEPRFGSSIAPLSSAVMREVLDRIARVPPSGKTPVVVFDLDETFIDNRAGTYAALRRWAAELHDYTICAKIDALSGPQDVVAGSAVDTMTALGFEPTDWAVSSFDEFFRQQFFHDDVIMRLGDAFPGVTDFAEAIENAGGLVVFLTGRVGPSQGEQTEAELRRVGLLGKNARMVATRYDKIPTPEYKRQAMDLLGASSHVVAVFDNDRNNLDALTPSQTLRVHVPVGALYKEPAWRLMLRSASER